jgi:hypothetical protein
MLMLLLLQIGCASGRRRDADLPAARGRLDSNLPLIVVDAGRQRIRDQGRIDARLKILGNSEGGRNNLQTTPASFSGSIGIEIRGQSSRSCPKKQYGFEIRTGPGGSRRDVSLLGMPAGSEWILQGPCFDRSLIRNVLAYQLSNRIGRYAVRTRFVEAFIQEAGSGETPGDYQGVFVLMEKITRGAERVNVAPVTDEDPRGGYLLKIDRGAEPGFMTARGTKILVADPESPTPAQIAYLKTYFKDFESALERPDFDDPSLGYAKYIDVDSFIDHFLLNELLRNVDAFRLSAYMHKDRGGKLEMGPVWDFDRSSGNIDTLASPEGWYLARRFSGYEPPFWWSRLLEDDTFRRRLARRWNQLREDALSSASLTAAIDANVSTLGAAADRNFAVWPFLGSRRPPFNRDPVASRTYAGEIHELKSFLVARADWIDRHVESLPSSSGGRATTRIRRGDPSIGRAWRRSRSRGRAG